MALVMLLMALLLIILTQFRRGRPILAHEHKYKCQD